MDFAGRSGNRGNRTKGSRFPGMDPLFRGGTLLIVKMLMLIAFIVLGAAFGLINDAPVRIDLYFIRPEMPLSLLLLLALGCGILLGGLVGMVYFMRAKKENADLRREARLVSDEVRNLRATPLKGP
jgi:uncharacterized integral membrane protein